MQCPICKKEIENSSIFCEYCGSKISFVPTKTVLSQFINSIVSKIENGYDDVATLTPDIDAIPFGMRNWIQISGALFYGQAPQDDITVTICLDGCNSDRLPIYQKYGYHRYDNDEGITKCYHWDERYKIANEVEDIVVTLVGAAKANTFASDEMFTKIIKDQQSAHEAETHKWRKINVIVCICTAILVPLIIFFFAWIFGEL